MKVCDFCGKKCMETIYVPRTISGTKVFVHDEMDVCPDCERKIEDFLLTLKKEKVKN